MQFITIKLMRSVIRRCFTSKVEGRLESPFGPLVNIKPYPGLKEKDVPKSIQVLKDESVGKVMHLIEKQHIYFLFNSAADYNHTVKYHNALKGRFLRKFTGTKGHPKSPYARSTGIKHRFHIFRMVQNVINKGMSQLGYHMFKDGTLNLSDRAPECSIMPELIRDWKAQLPQSLFENTFAKPDYFISVPLYHEALLGADLEKGVKYTLVTNEVLPLKGSYGVSMPFPGHFDLFEDFVCDILKQVEGKKVLDIGTNTSVFSTIMGFRAASKVMKYDPNKYAIKSLKMNITELELDKNKNLNINGIKQNLDKFDEKEKYDVIISMPPLLHCKHVQNDSDFANIHYDQDEKIFRQCFKIAGTNLADGGYFVLLFGDIGEIIGLNKPGIVQELCDEHELKIVSMSHKSYTNYEFYPTEYKEDIKDAQLSLFVIQKL